MNSWFGLCGLALAVIASSLLGASSARPASQLRADTTCNGIVCVFQDRFPRGGRVFTGGFFQIPHPSRAKVESFGCDAELGGWIAHDDQYGQTYFDGGIRLSPIIRRHWTRPDSHGIRHLVRATCSWRIPRGSRGKLLSLIPPTEALGDEEFVWGLHISYGLPDGAASSEQCVMTTWRVGFSSVVWPRGRYAGYC